ncbi:MAG TPA: hypothetical protein P5572_02500 [Phycisphaerae bacterium]|nr:hypothetical protein [Phycisphaerales bacterium]HRX83871.1 hypothetical protein [Phycisphaerae bacterium]
MSRKAMGLFCTLLGAGVLVFPGDQSQYTGIALMNDVDNVVWVARDKSFAIGDDYQFNTVAALGYYIIQQSSTACSLCGGGFVSHREQCPYYPVNTCGLCEPAGEHTTVEMQPFGWYSDSCLWGLHTRQLAIHRSIAACIAVVAGILLISLPLAGRRHVLAGQVQRW